ncbi:MULTISPECIES: PadR family transcriptional regulator [Cellulomonas]|uniref:PadR family transcriptional regulator n=1 Tax=Cellulomonas TaxID=1707 RepID=UPI0010A8ED93|nr:MULTISPECIES: PadR family transcriptional regulator [Cellulomonas]
MTVPMAMLAFLDEHPAHGFALKQRYDELLGHERELRSGQVYSTLARLERDGLARGVEIAKGEGPDRRVYAITQEGVAELEQWLATPYSTRTRPGELFTKVVLALVSGRSPEAVLAAQRALYLTRMRELTSARHAGDLVDRLAGDYEIAHLEADLRWIETAAARLHGGADGHGPERDR